MAQQTVEPSRGISAKSRRIEFSFADQFSAVWTKTTLNQLIVLFALQALVNSIIQNQRDSCCSQLGQVTADSPTPLCSVSSSPLNCDEDPDGIILDTERGNIYYVATPSNNDSIGVFGGIPPPTNLIDLRSQQQILGDNFTEPNEGPASGMWANANTPISNFYALKGRATIRGNSVITRSYCPKPRFVYPRVKHIPDDTNDSELDINDVRKRILDSWRSENIIAAYDFTKMDINSNRLHFTAFFNQTISGGSDLMFIINFVTNALWRTIISNNTSAYLIAAGTKNMPTPRKLNELDLVSLLGRSYPSYIKGKITRVPDLSSTSATIFIYVFHLLFPVMLQNLVFEKEYKLREIMKMMGLKTYVYWIVTYLFYFIIYVIASTLCVGIACAMGFRFFLVNSFLSYFLLLFFWGHTMIATAFFLSVFFTKTRTATVIGYTYVLAIGMFGPNVIQGYFDSPDTPWQTVFGLSIIPPFAFYRGLAALSRAVSFGGKGISMEELMLPEYGMADVYGFLIVEAAILMLFAIYLEAVLPIGPGVKAHPLFFIPKRYRCGSKNAIPDDEVAPSEADLPEDVAEERQRILKGNTTDVITVHNIRKVYPSRQGVPPKIAVKSLTMGIRQGECFGFLGPNGAGKSTTINMLCGYLRPTSGDAFVDGLSIRDDIDLIHLQMGVCPQDDCLWDDLTGAEHLRFYGRLKNLRGKDLDDQVEYWLKQVNLADPKTKAKFARQYSGGMKRRLSVAISLIGNPKVVLLDEPTTGLDPASRISLYEVIRTCKKDVAMMLTTHSMEEAEILCDRIGIFVSGNLKTVGTPADLKNRYGQFYRIIVTSDMSTEQKAKKFLEKVAPGIRLINTLAGTATYEVPRKNVKLSDIFAALASNQQRLGIKDWGVSNTTLEEVFLKITTMRNEDDEKKLFDKARRQKKKKGCCGKSKAEDEEELKNV